MLMVITKEYECWEFNIDNSNITGHWIGLFKKVGNKTEIDFTEQIKAKKFFMKPLLGIFIKKQQKRFIADLKKALSE